MRGEREGGGVGGWGERIPLPPLSSPASFSPPLSTRDSSSKLTFHSMKTAWENRAE